VQKVQTMQTDLKLQVDIKFILGYT